MNVDTPEPTTLDDIDLPAILSAVLAAHPPFVDAWLTNQPGTWGALAGQGIIATRCALDRPLTDTERRIVWQTLWDHLTLLRSARP